MANKLFGTKLFATALTTFALASCQSESTLLEPSADNMRDVKLTVTASKGELTRTNLELNDDQKKILLSWNLGDLIQVCEEDGRFAGTLQVTSFADDAHTQAKFEGNVRVLDRDGNHNLSFYYLGTAAEYKGVKGRQMADMVYDLSTQTYTDVNALAANDLLLDECEVTVTKGNAEFKSLYMKRQFAYGRFTLLYNDDPLQFDANTVVSVNTEKGDIKTGATVDFPSEITANGGSSISLTTSENDFYVTFVPGSEESKIKFNVTINGNEYEGYSNPYLIEKNDFVRKAQGLTKAEALPINMRRTDGSDDEHNFSLIYNANYGSNDTWTDNQEGVGNSYTFTLSEYNKIFDETNEGYTFTGWNTKADGTGESLLPNSTLTVAYPDGIANVYAQWVKTTYNYTLVHEDNDGNEIIKEEFESDGDLTVTTKKDDAIQTAPEGYEFAGWALKENPTVPVETVTFTKDNTYIVVVPVWKEKEYNWQVKWVDDPTVGNVTYKTKWEKGTAPHSLLSAFPDEQEKEYPQYYYHNITKEGYKFVGWEYNGKMIETDKSGNWKFADVVMGKEASSTTSNPSPVYIYAKWEKIEDPNTVTTPGYGHGTFK